MTIAHIKTAHRSHYPNPIRFQRGEPLTLGRRDDEYPGWVWTTTTDGNEGWAPLGLMNEAENGRSAIATEDYSARELNTETGERVTLLREMNNWAWVEREGGEQGWVPVTTLAY
ncbi:SH3 domain-containing protein [Saccharospirillum mangrovi]|uniref:SH3 domain-containing protein n=1 Tax=Saccharospirillum mangrovi TaxID=2161747 RepID=UPI000D39C917|nr:SH3 domain-containing protein [Saccharospirillum mangrovi]